MTTGPRICVLTASPLDASILAEALSREFQADVRIAQTREEALDLVRECGLAAIVEPPEDPLVFVRRLLQANPALETVVLEGVESLGPLPYLEAGAIGYVTRSDSLAVLLETLRLAREGHARLDPATTSAVLRRMQELSRLCGDQQVDVSRCGQLTEREREVARLLGDHQSNREIAHSLHISLGTVKSHVHSVLRKLDVESRSLAGVYWRIWEKDGEGNGHNGGDGRAAARRPARN